ncbi:erythroblast NAD(P)(+)--arginine ADP-ribosyltransferase-like [Dicentrarchus labrax]|uniref:NAD(P)(+)--arginine ADP-ribosyltransferase n=1 Tax=Dicentrarchus labrax TaxID=13489 RepID=A0A8C4HAP2_DICLA|nr:erythroblast NAD(P)(+)--arginine ADP-ribosyltransferase-like [Dicentrarchus labrax]
MKGLMLIFAPLYLLLCWMQPGGSVKISFVFTPRKANQVIQMSMVEDAVDDMYFGCDKAMTRKINDRYFEEENKGAIFASAWKNSEKCSKRNIVHDKNSVLTKNHRQAICVYTSDHEKFYEIFNAAVRTNRTIYQTSFPFHSLHFWLTSAVQILNNNMKCHNTYRRTKTVFTGNVNQIIRFGFFASSSYSSMMTHFGTKTCFNITTCSGAFLGNYPNLRGEEQEVLIPPYEQFKIKGKIPKKKNSQYVGGLDDCDVVYVLESAGVHSNLNCQAV